MSEISRRVLLRNIALAAAATGSVDAQDGVHVHQMMAVDKNAAGVYRAQALNAHEYATLERLTDLIIPGAKAADCAAWIDMLASANEQLLAIYTGGLAWLDRAMVAQTGNDFLSSPATEQTAMLDQIAYRRNNSPRLGPGIQFFAWVRRMTVDAYYTSKIGIADLDYRGNTASTKFEVPAEAIKYALAKSGYA